MRKKTYFSNELYTIKASDPKKLSAKSVDQLQKGIMNEIKRNSEKLNLSSDKAAGRFLG